MKRLRTILVILGASLALAVGWVLYQVRASSLPRAPQQAGFISLTNGVFGPGTGLAIFSITNQRNYQVFLYPSVDIQGKESAQTNYRSPTINAPNAYGIHLHPGEGAAVQVPLLAAGDGQWRARFAFVRDYYHFSAKLRRLPEELNAVWTGTSVAFSNEYFYSDWFQR